MSKSTVEYLRHIATECTFVRDAIRGKSFEDFIRDEVLKRAVVRSLEIIGEATKKIPADDKLKITDVRWKDMAGMRDRLIHDYVGVNYKVVWNVATNILPDLTLQIGAAIELLNQP